MNLNLGQALNFLKCKRLDDKFRSREQARAIERRIRADAAKETSEEDMQRLVQTMRQTENDPARYS